MRRLVESVIRFSQIVGTAMGPYSLLALTLLLLEKASQTISFPSCEELTRRRLSWDQSWHSTLPMWPLSTRLGLMARLTMGSSLCATEKTARPRWGWDGTGRRRNISGQSKR